MVEMNFVACKSWCLQPLVPFAEQVLSLQSLGVSICPLHVSLEAIELKMAIYVSCIAALWVVFLVIGERETDRHREREGGEIYRERCENCCCLPFKLKLLLCILSIYLETVLYWLAFELLCRWIYQAGDVFLKQWGNRLITDDTCNVAISSLGLNSIDGTDFLCRNNMQKLTMELVLHLKHLYSVVILINQVIVFSCIAWFWHNNKKS